MFGIFAAILFAIFFCVGAAAMFPILGLVPFFLIGWLVFFFVGKVAIWIIAQILANLGIYFNIQREVVPVILGIAMFVISILMIFYADIGSEKDYMMRFLVVFGTGSFVLEKTAYYLQI